MPSFRSFHDGVVERAKTDVEFRRSLLRECAELLLNKEFEVAHRLVRDYIRSTPYIERLAEDLEIDGGIDSVVKLFDPDVNPGGIQMLAALIVMMTEEGLALAVRRDLGRQRPRHA